MNAIRIEQPSWIQAAPGVVSNAAAAAAIALLDLAVCTAYWSVHGVDWVQVSRGPAAWVVGNEATHAMGSWASLLGVAVLYCLAAAELAAYRWLALRIPRLFRQPMRWGMLYGACVFAVLERIVLPLSAAPDAGAEGAWFAALLLIYVLAIGPACALFARRCRSIQ